MYTYLNIKNFRCFEDLELDDLGLVNLIAGMNNIGKTALLEAVFLHCVGLDPRLIFRLNALRGVRKMRLNPKRGAEHPLSSFYNRFDTSEGIELVGEDTLTGRRSLWLGVADKPSESIPPYQIVSRNSDENDIHLIVPEYGRILSPFETPKMLELKQDVDGETKTYSLIIDKNGIHSEPPLPPTPISAFFQAAGVRVDFSKQAEDYGNMELNNRQDEILRVLKVIEPRLKGIRTVAVADGPVLHGDVGINRLVPLPLMGEGVVRLANLALNISNTPDGIGLIDEIENGLHHSILPNVWEAIAVAAKQSNTQIFATTHSYECIKAAHEAFSSEETYDFRLHRLGRVNGQVKAVTYDQGTLDAALKAELEVR